LVRVKFERSDFRRRDIIAFLEGRSDVGEKVPVQRYEFHGNQLDLLYFCGKKSVKMFGCHLEEDLYVS
jgi:hypothetical protein